MWKHSLDAKSGTLIELFDYLGNGDLIEFLEVQVLEKLDVDLDEFLKCKKRFFLLKVCLMCDLDKLHKVLLGHIESMRPMILLICSKENA
jgi:hypothetical protein